MKKQIQKLQVTQEFKGAVVPMLSHFPDLDTHDWVLKDEDSLSYTFFLGGWRSTNNLCFDDSISQNFVEQHNKQQVDRQY